MEFSNLTENLRQSVNDWEKKLIKLDEHLFLKFKTDKEEPSNNLLVI